MDATVEVETKVNYGTELARQLHTPVGQNECDSITESLGRRTSLETAYRCSHDMLTFGSLSL